MRQSSAVAVFGRRGEGQCLVSMASSDERRRPVTSRRFRCAAQASSGVIVTELVRVTRIKHEM